MFIWSFPLLVVNKSILSSESDYFKAMFNNEWMETNTNCITIKEMQIKPFINVLKIAYGLSINHKEWNEAKIQELNESIIIANKYQFNRVEKILSNELIARFSSIGQMSCTTFQTVLDIYQMSKNKNLDHLRDLWLNFIDENADEVLKRFDELLISHQMLFEIISRDSFGVKEIDLFKALMDWIRKTRLKLSYDFYEEEELLLKAIRFSFITDEDIENSIKPCIKELFIPLFTDSMVDQKLKELIDKNFNETNRVSIQTEKSFTANKYQTIHTSYPFADETVGAIPEHDFPARVYSNCVIYIFNLPLITKINCIKFKIMPNNNSRSFWDKSLMSYIIEVEETNCETGKQWKTVVDYSDKKCIGLQELYFDENITNSIRIVHKSSEELFKIHSISYKYTKSPLKLFNNIIRPLNEITAINGMECLIGIGSKERNITYYILRDYEYETIINDLVPKLNRNNDFKTNYYIKFPQPFAIDSFQFDLITENNNSLIKFNAVIEVSIASELSFDLLEHNWVKVSEEVLKVKECVTCNVEFELQMVSMIRICGFRSSISDKKFLMPLLISRVRVPADRSTCQWINGKTLSLADNRV